MLFCVTPQPMYGDMPIKPAVILTRAPHYDLATMGSAWGADSDDKKVHTTRCDCAATIGNIS